MQDMSQLQLPPQVLGASTNARAGSRATANDVRAGLASAQVSAAQPATTGTPNGSALPAVSDPSGAANRQRLATQSQEHLRAAIADMNRYVQSIQRDLKFSIDESSGQSVVQVIDRSTQEVVRQIPSDVALRLARNLKLQQMRYASDAGAVKSTAGDAALIDTRT